MELEAQLVEMELMGKLDQEAHPGKKELEAQLEEMELMGRMALEAQLVRLDLRVEMERTDMVGKDLLEKLGALDPRDLLVCRNGCPESVVVIKQMSFCLSSQHF